MDLYSGQPYWLVKNRFDDFTQPLTKSIRTPVAIIGSGITGALVAHKMCMAGIECCVFDKRSLSTGSSVASTALIQYEIDVPLSRMIEKMPVDAAVSAYRACLDSIEALEKTFNVPGIDAAFVRRPTLYLATDRKGRDMIPQEYEIRKKFGLPVTLLSAGNVNKQFGLNTYGALYNHNSAQMDVYRAATGLWSATRDTGKLQLYPHTEIVSWSQQKNGYQLETANGHSVEAEYVVIATGFEAEDFLPRKLMQLTTTFALISEPVDALSLWPENALIWETREPYLYIRTDGQRIIVGGEDEPYHNVTARKFLLPKKTRKLEKKFRKMFPHIPFRTEFSWAGTFSSTTDGLPIIGPTAEDPHMLFVLGYGGNGITFSMIGAEILTNLVSGKPDKRLPVFSPDRLSLK